jgi:hypothetical protein
MLSAADSVEQSSIKGGKTLSLIALTVDLLSFARHQKFSQFSHNRLSNLGLNGEHIG